MDWYKTSTGVWPPLADLMDRAQSDGNPAENPASMPDTAPLLGDAAVAAAYDPVTNPAHYALDPQPLDVIEAWSLGYHEGNILKYIARWREKGGVQDLRKAAEYLRRLIAVAERP